MTSSRGLSGIGQIYALPKASTERLHARANKLGMVFPEFVRLRHPDNVGFIVSFLTLPFILGSRSTLIPASIAAGITVIRTSLEDRTLRDELEGYERYAAKVKFRLVSGLW